MGSPAVPTKAELADAFHLAEEINAAVEQDTKTPIEVLGGRDLASNLCTSDKEAEIEHRLLVLAQLVLRQDREIELLRRVSDWNDAHRRGLMSTIAFESCELEELRNELEELRK